MALPTNAGAATDANVLTLAPNTPTVFLGDPAAVPGDIQVVGTNLGTNAKGSATLSIALVAVAGGTTDLANQRDAGLKTAVATLRSWSTTAQGTTVTAGNVVAVTQVIVNNLGTFYSRFADLLQSLGKG